MLIEPDLLRPVCSFLGGLFAANASLLGAIYTHPSQDRDRRVASDIAKRETVYAGFMMSASNLLLNAYSHVEEEVTLGGDEQRLIGLINRPP
jgi:hypothetical protein